MKQNEWKEREYIDIDKDYRGVDIAPDYYYLLFLKRKESSNLLMSHYIRDLYKYNWPNYCCLCLAPANRFGKIVGENYITDDKYGLPQINPDSYTVIKIKMKIPYCKTCYSKVKRIFGPNEPEGIAILPSSKVSGAGAIMFMFRNPEYGKLFYLSNINNLDQLQDPGYII